jgi:DNA-binding NarL/FixJ family response regulator
MGTLMSDKLNSERAGLISDHPLVLEKLSRALKQTSLDIEQFLLDWSTFDDAQVVSLPTATTFAIDAPDPLKAKLLCSRILIQQPDARILVLSESFPEDHAFALLRFGVKGLLTYHEMDEQLTRALEAVSKGGYWVPRTTLSKFVESLLSVKNELKGLNSPARVSPRERDVLDALLKNESNKEIANRLNISERTVKFHVSNLLSKYSVGRRADLIVLWLTENGKGVDRIH